VQKLYYFTLYENVLRLISSCANTGRQLGTEVKFMILCSALHKITTILLYKTILLLMQIYFNKTYCWFNKQSAKTFYSTIQFSWWLCYYSSYNDRLISTSSANLQIKSNHCTIYRVAQKSKLMLKVKLCFVLDRLSVFINIRRRYCHTEPKIKLQTLVHIFTK